jgi:hypothetical protein
MTPNPAAVIDMMNKMKQEAAAHQVDIDLDDYETAHRIYKQTAYTYTSAGELAPFYQLVEWFNQRTQKEATAILKALTPTILFLRHVWLWIAHENYRKHRIETYTDRAEEARHKAYLATQQNNR